MTDKELTAIALAGKILARGVGEWSECETHLARSRRHIFFDSEYLTIKAFVSDWRVFGALNDQRTAIEMPIENDWPKHAREGIEIVVGLLEAHSSSGFGKAIWKWRHTTRPYTSKDRTELIEWLLSLRYD